MGTQMRGAISAGTQLGAEIVAGTVRQRLFKSILPGTVAATLADLGIGAVLGIGAQKFLGRQVGQDVITGVWAGTLRRTAKQLHIGAINDVLGAPDTQRFVRGANGQWQPLGSYVGSGDQRALGSYVGSGDQRALGDEMEKELYGVDL